jgi:hypothetical protein
MYIVVNHAISHPEKFWGLAKAMTVPAPLKLHSVFPSTDGARGTCLWEGQSVDAVKQFVDGATNAFSKNDYMAVEAGSAMGLPK